MSWWALRTRFEHTHRAVTQGAAFEPDWLISLDPTLDELPQLLLELATPTYSINAAGKVVVDKMPESARSPNLGDALCIAFAPLATEGGFFSVPAPATGAAQEEPAADIETPRRCDAVFAAAAAGIGAERDAIAVVYFALTAMTDLWPPLVVLDWSVEHIEGSLLDAWTLAVLQRVAALDRECEARSGVSGLMIEAEGLGVELCERAYHWGLAVELTADELVKIDLAQRAVSASSYVRGGKVVFSRVAREKTQAFRGVLRNHLVDCATKFNGAEPVQPELLAAFSDGVLAALKNRRVRERRAA